MKMVSIVDERGTKQFVNPEYVTAIEDEKYSSGASARKVWVMGHAGYHTFSIITQEAAIDLAIRLEKESK